MALDFEKKYYSKDINFIAGTDEAGRGPLLGPVFAAAVILPKDFSHPLINDSKKLSAKKRIEAFDIIIKNAISYAIVSISAKEIDEINILNASRKAMELALKKLNHQIDFIITDAMKINSDIPYIPLIKGDAKALSVASASILAKVSRDAWCYEIDRKYPFYHIAKNKGYGTKDHLEALDLYGPIEGLHRFSYAPVKKAMYKKITLF